MAIDLFKRNERAERIRAYKRVFESEDGKKVLQDLMKSCHVFTSTMDESANEVIYREGSRSVVLRIMRTISINPSEFERMLNETN